jgi:protein CpxP
MKKTLSTFALSGLLAAGMATAAFAQTDNSAQQPTTDQAAPAQAGAQGHHMRQADPDRQVAMMTKHLKLSADQQSQIKPILEDRAQQMQALQSDQATPRADKRAKFKSIRDDSNQKIEAVLNDTQKQKFEAMQQKREARMQAHHEKQQQGDTSATPQS